MKARNLKNTGGEWNAEVKKQMLEWSHDEVSTLVKSLVSTIPGPDYQILHLQHTTHPSPPPLLKVSPGKHHNAHHIPRTQMSSSFPLSSFVLDSEEETVTEILIWTILTGPSQCFSVWQT